MLRKSELAQLLHNAAWEFIHSKSLVTGAPMQQTWSDVVPSSPGLRSIEIIPLFYELCYNVLGVGKFHFIEQDRIV
jgi:hypothetical protein